MGGKRRYEAKLEYDVSPADELNPYAQSRPRRRAPRFELAGLDEVPWAELEDAYGPATAVPSQLRALASPDPADREWALDALDACIHHQGSVYNASTAAVPFLIRLAADRRVDSRERILQLLCGIAVHEPSGCLVNGAYQWRSEAYDAVKAGMPIFIELLADSDADVRVAAAFVLAFVDPPTDGAIDVLLARATSDDDERVRASALLAVGYTCRYARRTDLSDSLTAQLDTGTPLLQLCAALALAQLHADAVTAGVRGALDRGRETPPRVAGFWPWADGDMKRFATVVRGAIQSTGEVLTDMRATTNPANDGWDAPLRALRRVFPADADRTDELMLPGDLDDAQREVLRYFADNCTKQLIGYDYMTARGLPRYLDELRRFLGINPAGPLDAEVRVEARTLPIWYALHGALVGTVSRAAVVDAWAQLPAAEALAAATDALDGPYRPAVPRRYHDFTAEGYRYENDYYSAFIELVADALLRVDGGEAWARELADRLLPLERRPAVSALVAATILLETARRRRRPPAEDLDALIRLDGPPASSYRQALHRALALLPVARRTALMSCLSLGNYTVHQDPSGQVKQWREGNAWDLFDLMEPRAGAQAIIDAANEYDRHQGAVVGDPEASATSSVTSSIRLRHPADEPFPHERAIELLAGYGSVIVPLLAAIERPGPTLAATVAGALARMAS